MIREVIRYGAMLVALCVFGYASYQLETLHLQSQESDNAYADVNNLFTVDTEDVEYATNENGENIVINNTSDGSFNWDYDLLLSYNPEAKGYIRQTGGPHILDYPILQHTDNSYYLEHLPNNAYNTLGSIFIDYRITEGLEAKNCIIYGHRVTRSEPYTMFGSLIEYTESQEYCDEHPTMDIYVGYKHYKYYVFAAYRTPVEGSPAYQYLFADDNSFLNYVATAKNSSIYSFPQAGTITANDKIITLSTCTIDNWQERVIVQLVRREEIID